MGHGVGDRTHDWGDGAGYREGDPPSRRDVDRHEVSGSGDGSRAPGARTALTCITPTRQTGQWKRRASSAVIPLQTRRRKVVGAAGFEPATPCAQGSLTG